MGTFATISIPEKDVDKFNSLFNVVREVESALSDFDDSAEIATLNEKRELELSPLALEAVKLAFLYNKESNGYFDIAIGTITRRAYRFGLNERVPSVETLQSASVGMENIDIKGNRVRLKNGVLLDFGGMGKGFAVDKVAKKIKEYGIERAIVSISGDIRCIGKCRFGVTLPYSIEESSCYESKTEELAISTSGVYRRFVKSWKNNHLIDVKGRHPEKEIVSLTLLAEGTNSELDAFATAASTMPPFEAAAFLDEKGYGFLMFLSNGGVLSNGKWIFFVKECKNGASALRGLL